MFETYRMLGHERQIELESEAARLRPLAGRSLGRIWVVLAAVVLTALAFAATAARAEVWPGGRSGALLSSQVSSPDAVDRAVANHKTHVLAPDDRTRVRGSEASYPDAVGRAVASHQADLQRTAQSSTVAQPGDGFDWGAAGVGASTTAALLLALGIGIGMARRTRSAAA